MALTPVTMTGALKSNLKQAWTAFNQLITDLASTASGKGASCIGIKDTAGNLTATNMEDAIAEVYADHAASRTMSELFNENSATTTGLTWGYTGGKFRTDADIITVAAGTVSLTDNTTNYIEVGTDGAVSVVASAFTSGRIPIRTVLTSSGVQTVSTDKRAWFYTWATAPSNTAYATSWNGVTDISPSKNAVYDQMEIRGPSPVTKYIGSYADLPAAITAIGAIECLLIINANVNLSADATVPATLVLQVKKGAVITIATTKTLTVNGPLESGLYQIFSCTGTGKVVFDSGIVKEVYPEWWGVATGTGDSTAAIQAAINSLPSGGKVTFQARTYYLTSVTVPYALTLQGAGKNYGGGSSNTKLVITSTTADGFVVTTVDTVRFFDMVMRASVTREAGAYIHFLPATGENVASRIENILFADAYNGINFEAAANWTVDKCLFVDHYSVGIKVDNTNNSDSGDSTIINSLFSSSVATHPSSVHILQHASGGLRIVNNKFLKGNYHYLGQFTGGDNTGILLIENNSSEDAVTANFSFSATTPTVFIEVLIQNNHFTVGDSAYGIVVLNSGYDYLNMMTVDGNLFNLDTNAVCMEFGRGDFISVGKNLIHSSGSGTIGVSVLATVTAISIAPQHFFGTTANRWTGTGTFANVTFNPPFIDSGSVGSIATTTAYGALFVSAEQTVTFAVEFMKPPIIDATVKNDTGYGVGVLLGDVTMTTFKYKIISSSNSGNAGMVWKATAQ